MSRVLVTGATGLIGAAAMAEFARLGMPAVGIARRGTADVIACDLFDRARLRGVLAEVRPSHVLHLAWDVAPGRFMRAQGNLDWVAATLDLARHAAALGVRRFVGVGSCAEYDWRDGGARARREDDAAEPDSLYGAAKDGARRMLAALFRETDASFAWARPFLLFGAGESPLRLVRGLVEALRAGRPFVCRHGQLLRDYNAAEEAGAALAALVMSGVTGVVNIASGEPVTLAELAGFVAGRLGRPDLLDLRAEPAPGQPAAMTADVTRLRNEVGFHPRAALREHLARMAG